MKTSGKICDVLIEAGIDYVFGIPGGGTSPVWLALSDKKDKINTFLARHEQSASCMADMYGRMTGKPGVLMGQGPFIASNGTFGILEAYLFGSPMIVITDTSDAGFSQHGNYQSGTGEYGSYDIVGILRSMSKYVTYATTPEEAVRGVQLAIKHATTGRPGPAAVVMRTSAAFGEIDPEKNPRIHATQGYLPKTLSMAPAGDIDRANHLLMEAKKPVIIAGSGVHVSRAYGELQGLAELLGIPVATSYRGKSAFREIHPQAIGMMGTFGQKIANSVINEADLILVVGCRLSPSDTRFENPELIDPSRQRIIQIDIEPKNVGWTFPVEMGLVGDLKTVLGQLLDNLKGMKTNPAKGRIEDISKRKNEEGYYDAPECHSDASPLLPQRIVKEIDNAIDTDTIVTLDAGNNRLWTTHFLRSKGVGNIFCPGGIAGMGWGPSAALAAKLLHPDSPVLSVVGDGGFAMVPHVLATAIQYNLPAAFLVMNNSALGMVRDNQRGKIHATEFPETDFTQIARAFGCEGISVKKPDELGPAINKALKAKVPTVIDVATTRDEPYFKIASF